MKILPRKRLFLGLLLALELVIAIGLFLLWYVPTLGFESFGKGLSTFTGWIAGIILLLFSAAILIIVLTILRGKEMPGAKKLRGILIRFGMPVITAIGRLLKIPKDDIRRSFIEINNELVRSELHKSLPGRVLVLLPHCVQRDTCPYRITVEVNNCRQCGQCDFSELTQIAADFGIEMTVATGGTLARRVVIETNPDMILGIACERDLSSGIADTYPLPVLGVLLDRPEGPCINTRVSVEQVRDALTTFLPLKADYSEEKAESGP